MRRPFWRSQTQHWYIKVGKTQQRLSDKPDPDGGSRKDPPPAVQNRWHEIERLGVPKDLKVKQVVDLFLEVKRGQDSAKSTLFMLEQFKAFVGPTLPVSKLRPYHLTEFLKTKPQWAPSSIRTCVNRVHAALNWAVRQGRVDKNPISSVAGYTREGHYEKREGLISPDLAERLEATCQPAFAAFLRALRYTGARPVELRRALIEKCRLDDGYFLVPNKTARQTKKKERKIYLSAAGVQLFREMIGDRTAGPVFLTLRKKQAWTKTNLDRQWWKLTRQRVEIPEGVTLYTYRGTFISTAINDHNINPAVVAHLAGHSIDILFKHYLRENPEALRAAVEAINGPRSAAPPETGPGPTGG